MDKMVSFFLIGQIFRSFLNYLMLRIFQRHYIAKNRNTMLLFKIKKFFFGSHNEFRNCMSVSIFSFSVNSSLSENILDFNTSMAILLANHSATANFKKKSHICIFI